MFNAVMLDLETMGNTSGAAIVAIGAVRFDRRAGAMGESFYRSVDLESSVAGGGVIDPSTVLWWLKQSDPARAEITSSSTIPMTLALDAFAQWLEAGDNVDEVWGNGADFDNVILTSAYLKHGKVVPWSFWENRCYRTLKNMRPDVKAPKREGVHHNALDDARYQAAHLLKILERLDSHNIARRADGGGRLC